MKESSYRKISYFKVVMGTGFEAHFEIEVDLKKNIMKYSEVDLKNLSDSLSKHRKILLNQERKEKIYQLLIKYQFLKWYDKFKDKLIIDANGWEMEFILNGKRFQVIWAFEYPENWDEFLDELKEYFQDTGEGEIPEIDDEIPEIKINGSITLPFAMTEDEAYKFVMKALESKDLSFEGSLKTLDKD